MSTALHTGVEELAGAFGHVYQAARLYPEGHPLRKQRCDHLLTAWKTLVASHPELTIDFDGRRLLPAGGTPYRCTSIVFDELAGNAVEAGLSTCTLRGYDGGYQALNLIRSLAAGGTGQGLGGLIPGGEGEIEVARIPVVAATSAASPRTLLGQVWSALVKERRFDDHALGEVVRAISSARGDGIVEPVVLDWSEHARAQLLSHSMNVARLVHLAARVDGLRSSKLFALVEASLLCDVGMLHVPENLLQSHERLRPAEFRMIRKHPADGARILLATPGAPLLAAVVAFEHHRLCHGQGYPHSGRFMPSISSAQLVQVADVYAALRTPRSFRNAVPEEAARALLAKQRGDKLDPRAVDLMLDQAVPAGIGIPDLDRS